MGWASGSRLFGEIIDRMKLNIDDVVQRKNMYIDLIEAFEDADCDTLYECLGHDDCFDLAFEELYPDHYEHLQGDEE